MPEKYNILKTSTSNIFVVLFFLVITFSSSYGFAMEECSQIRKTLEAPQKYLSIKNPLPPDSKTLKTGESLFRNRAKPIACKTCHGITGNGKGDPGFESTPSARNFTCAKIMNPQRITKYFYVWIFRFGG
jgi:hypothetical protein